MKKKKIKNRVNFVHLAIKDNKSAAKKLRSYSNSLENCKTTSDIIFALSEIFGVSERTIIRDIVNDL